MDTFTNPLEDGSFLLSVVQVIVDSLHEQFLTSPHDLLDAYTTFSNRIRSQSQVLQDHNKPLPALDSLVHYRDKLARALRRDVRLALVDPFSTPSSLHSFSEQITSGAHLPAYFKVDTKQYARDLSSLCQYALCALTTIFRFPTFHSLFTEHDLCLLFGDILDISLADPLPVLNETKIYSLSLWTLTCHRLPISVLCSRQDNLLSALRRSLDTTRQPRTVVLDGLKAIVHLLENYSTDLHLVLSPLIPHVIMILLQESSELRLSASLVLGKLASVFIHRKNHSLTEWQKFSSNVLSYLELSSDTSRMGTTDTALFLIVRAAISMESQICRGDGPSWILAVLASLIIICGPALFSKPAALRFVLQSLALALKHKRSIIRFLYAHVWKCLVWTFGYLLPTDEDVQLASTRSALDIVKQELRGGIGIVLVSVLLTPKMSVTHSPELSDRISHVLSTIEAMVHVDCEHTRREGFVLLLALTSGAIAPQFSLRIYEIPALVLFDGTVIDAEWGKLPSAVNSIPTAPLSIRQLEEAKIAKYYEPLLRIWKCVASRGARERDSNLIEIWHCVLLAQARQLESDPQAAVVEEVLRYASATIAECLPSITSAEHQSNWGSWSVQDQLWVLTFIEKLWSVMRSAFVAFSLRGPASHILASILKHAFHIRDPEVQRSWGALCANLMVTASSSFLHDTHVLTESHMVVSMERELWGVVAKSLSSSRSRLDWKELIKFLAIPICVWVLTEPELQAWEGLLCSPAISAEDVNPLVERFITQYFQRTEIENWESTIPLLRSLLVYVDERGHSLPAKLLRTIDASLTTSYSLASHSSESLRHSLQLLVVIRRISSSGPAVAMQIVQALRNCLCVWIEDRREILSLEDFNSVVVSLYCDTLKVLEAVPLSVQSLNDLALFLASAFSRIPIPAIAPFAFERFWRATYHGRSEFYGVLPPKILSCLACFVDAFGGDLAEGLSLPSETQKSISDGQSRRDFGETDASENHWSLSIGNEDMSGGLGGEPTPQALRRSSASLLDSRSDDPPRPTILRQLEGYRSEMGTLLDEVEHSTSNPSQNSDTIPLSLRLLPSSRSIPPIPSIEAKAKRKTADQDAAPRKQSRTSRSILRSVRELESEPATRDVTPVDAAITRTRSLPPKRKSKFDGVQAPTFREVLRRERVKKMRKREHTPILLASFTSAPRTPSSRAAYRARTPPHTLPSSVESDEDLDWENFHIDATSSELDIERSLADVYNSSPPHSLTSVPQDDHSRLRSPSRSNLRRARSHSVASPPVSTNRQDLRRVDTGSGRLDALFDLYTSSEILQATRLVHQIGAVLTEQMGKKMDNSK